MLFAFLLSIGNEVYDLKLKMPKTASCCCPHHKTWGHSDEVELRVATDFEVKICQIDKDGRHKGRKKRICTSCRSRIQLEEKCDKLQVRFFFCMLVMCDKGTPTGLPDCFFCSNTVLSCGFSLSFELIGSGCYM